MKKILFCLVSNLRAVALSLAAVCSTIAIWATPSEGDTFTDGDLGYTVTSVDPYECSVKCTDKSVTEVKIPETVSHSDVEFKVTSIEVEAFMGCTSLSNVTIPASAASIGKYAFGYCPLIQVTCVGVTPPVCASSAFHGAKVANCTLVVPTGSEGAYMKTNVWKDFGKIVDPSGVEDVKIDDNAVEMERYSINGVKLSAPQKGVNIVKMSDGSVKEVVVSE